MAGVVYENIDLTGKDFSNQDLSNVKFVLCDFDDTLFVNANLTNRFVYIPTSCHNRDREVGACNSKMGFSLILAKNI